MDPILILLAVLLQFAFSGSETGLVRANWIRLRTWVGENRRGAGPALALLDRKEMALITTLVGTNVCIVIGSSLSERLFLNTLGRNWTLVSVLVMSALSLAFGTFLPKTLAQAHPERWLAALAPLLGVARFVFSPVSWLLGRLSGVKTTGTVRFSLTRKDVVFALRENARAEHTAGHISGIAARVLDFPDVLVREVITPLDRVVAVPDDVSLPDLKKVFAGHSYTRLPVYRHRRDHIVGITSMRDLVYTGRLQVRAHITVPADARAIEVMNLMREGSSHIAVVEDQPHQAIGIVTLEDLLEEVVGEIRSEE